MLNTWLRWLGFKNPLPDNYEFIAHTPFKPIDNIQDKTPALDQTTRELSIPADQITRY